VGWTARAARPRLLLLAVLAALLVGMLILIGFGQALGARGKHQRAADLAAVSGAQVMLREYPRLFEPAFLESGMPNPRHLSNAAYLALAHAAARRGARRNGVPSAEVGVAFPDAGFAPTRITVTLRRGGDIRLAGGRRRDRLEVRARATAELVPGDGIGIPGHADGGGYRGPLAYRQGKPMRPDVALAFDRMAAAARREAGLYLSITSGYRSDAEQAVLWAANPDPKWVAPPGRSLHRYGTELDLGPPAAYGWLAANSERFGFVRRYPHEPWHYGLPLARKSASEAGGCRRAHESYPVRSRPRYWLIRDTSARPSALVCDKGRCEAAADRAPRTTPFRPLREPARVPAETLACRAERKCRCGRSRETTGETRAISVRWVSASGGRSSE
jgi:D-alanyl-D-alanine carboxypeptidase